MAWRVGRMVLGCLFLGLGVIGLFLPFLQGILFLVIGLSLLSSESKWARHYHERLSQWVKRPHKARRNHDDANGRKGPFGRQAP